MDRYFVILHDHDEGISVHFAMTTNLNIVEASYYGDAEPPKELLEAIEEYDPDKGESLVVVQIPVRAGLIRFNSFNTGHMGSSYTPPKDTEADRWIRIY